MHVRGLHDLGQIGSSVKASISQRLLRNMLQMPFTKVYCSADETRLLVQNSTIGIEQSGNYVTKGETAA